MENSNTTPSEADIKKVSDNLLAIQHLNDYIYNHSDSLVNNAFLLMTEPDTDPGTQIGFDIATAAFSGIGSSFGPIGSFIATFLNAIFGDWKNNPPPSLNTNFAKLFLRLSKINSVLDEQLAVYNSDIKKYWNKSFTFNGNTTTISNLAEITIPTEGNTQFYSLYNAAILSLDQSIWLSILKSNYVISKIYRWARGQYQPIPFTLPGGPNKFPNDLANKYLTDSSYSLVSNGYIDQPGSAGAKGWWMQEYNLAKTETTSEGLSKDACNYLFKNQYTSDNYHAKKDFQGLFERSEVFTSSGISVKRVNADSIIRDIASNSNDSEYKKAMLTGNTLGALTFKEGRKSIEERIIKKAQEDPVFARKLSLQPNETLEDFLGVKIPKSVFFNIIVEDQNMYALVIPRKGVPEPPVPYKES